MNNELLLLIKKLTDTFFEQTKTKPRKKPEIKLKKQMENISFNPLINLSEEGKWFLAVTSFQANNYIFNITDENSSFSITTSGYWTSRRGAATINKLRDLLALEN